MKLLAILSLLLNQACSHANNPALFISFSSISHAEPVTAHQCGFPVSVGYDRSLDKESIQIVEDSIEFWNQQFNFQIFKPVGLVNSRYSSPLNWGVTVIGYKEVPPRKCEASIAKTYIKPNLGNGCILASWMELTCPLSAYTYQEQRFIIKHEIGHLLGLDESHDETHTMFWSLVGAKISQKISAEEYLNIKSMYHF